MRRRRIGNYPLARGLLKLAEKKTKICLPTHPEETRGPEQQSGRPIPTSTSNFLFAAFSLECVRCNDPATHRDSAARRFIKYTMFLWLWGSVSRIETNKTFLNTNPIARLSLRVECVLPCGLSPLQQCYDAPVVMTPHRYPP